MTAGHHRGRLRRKCTFRVNTTRHKSARSNESARRERPLQAAQPRSGDRSRTSAAGSSATAGAAVVPYSTQCGTGTTESPALAEIKLQPAAAAPCADWCAPAHAARPQASDESAAYCSARACRANVAPCRDKSWMYRLVGLSHIGESPSAEHAPPAAARPGDGASQGLHPVCAPCAPPGAGGGCGRHVRALALLPHLFDLAYPGAFLGCSSQACVPGRRAAGSDAAAEAGAACSSKRQY